MKKKTGADIYSPALRKGARKIAKMSAAEIAKAKAEFDRKIAEQSAKAAEIPKLRAENERLENKRDEFIFRVAQLAAQINPKLFEESPKTAIDLALKRLRDTRRILNEIAQEKELKDARAVADAGKTDLANWHVEYENGVKLITGELKDWDRALKKFKRYVEARKLTEGSSIEKVLAHYRQQGFTGPELVMEVKAFNPWLKQEKSTQAREAAKCRGRVKKKRGRVKRPKSDLRVTENRRHKQGYCRVCGKRVRPRERVCDQHLKGKPFEVSSGSKDLAVLVNRKSHQKPSGVTTHY